VWRTSEREARSRSGEGSKDADRKTQTELYSLVLQYITIQRTLGPGSYGVSNAGV